MKEDRRHGWRSRSCPVTARKHFLEDLLLAAFFDSLEAGHVMLRKHDAADWGWKHIARRRRATDRAERTGRRECWGGREVSVEFGVYWHQAWLILLEEDGGLVVL